MATLNIPVMLGSKKIGDASVSPTSVDIVARIDMEPGTAKYCMHLRSFQAVMLGIEHERENVRKFHTPNPGTPLGNNLFTDDRVLVRDDTSLQYGWVGYVESRNRTGKIVVVFPDSTTPRLKAFHEDDLEVLPDGE